MASSRLFRPHYPETNQRRGFYLSAIEETRLARLASKIRIRRFPRCGAGRNRATAFATRRLPERH
jgi:hypothetical protein